MTEHDGHLSPGLHMMSISLFNMATIMYSKWPPKHVMIALDYAAAMMTDLICAPSENLDWNF